MHAIQMVFIWVFILTLSRKRENNLLFESSSLPVPTPSHKLDTITFYKKNTLTRTRSAMCFGWVNLKVAPAGAKKSRCIKSILHPGLHNLFHSTIQDGSTWSKFGARGEHGDVFLFSNWGALWFTENLIRYSLHVCLREVKNNLFSFRHPYLRHLSWRFWKF